MPDLSRRNFLKLTSQTFLAASSVLGLGAILRFLGFQSEPVPRTAFDLGPAEDYPTGSSTLLADVPALLRHTESGFSAIDLTCTHLGCSVQQDLKGLVCPCHGSRFGEDGEVLHGPAEKSLTDLVVETTTDGNLILHKG